MRTLAQIARKYDKGYGHFTTRQNIQYNWPALKDIPDILAELAEVEMHALQTSGNCIRNVTADQYAGAAADEIEDPRPWAEIIRQWSSMHPEFSFLPRKFKVAVTGAPSDRAAVAVHDIGVRIVRTRRARSASRFWSAAGRRTPMLGKTIRPFVEKQHLLSYLEAILRVYNEYGRRDNLFKARIKILVHEIGIDEFRARRRRMGGDEGRFGRIARVRTRSHHRLLSPPPLEDLPPVSLEFEQCRSEDADFARWSRINLVAHRQPGYAIVNLSLKPTGGVPGDATADQMDAIAELADRYSFGEIRVTHEQNLTFPHVRQSDLYALWLALGPLGLATPNIGQVTDIIACPGLDYCSLANARSIPIASALPSALTTSPGCTTWVS